MMHRKANNLLHYTSIRNYRARYQIKTKARMMPLTKWLRKKNKAGQEIPESIITDINIAKESRENSDILSMVNSYDGKQENIPLISDRFFQKYFLSSFNKCNNSEELTQILINLKNKLSSPKSKENNNDNINNKLEKFENNVLRLGYHSCIARCSFASDNNVNDGKIDIESISKFFNECKSMNLINIDTYSLTLNGYINHGDCDKEINALFHEFQKFVDNVDPTRPQCVISTTPYIQGYIAEQNEKYSDIYSQYLSYLCLKENKDDLIKAIEIFYNGIEQRYIIPNTETQLLLMKHIGDETGDFMEICRIFRIIASYTVNSPSIDYYNKYLQLLSKFGDIDEGIKILRLLVFKKYWNYMSIPDAPLPNLQTFELIFKCLKVGIENNRMTQDVGARKAEYVLKQMKELKIGTPHSVYKLLYEVLGVSWWDSLPWHLRLINRP